MGRKIHRWFLWVGLLCVLVSTMVISLVYQGAFRTQMKQNLALVAALISQSDTDEIMLYHLDEIQISIFTPDGNLIFDSAGTLSQAENSQTYPEVTAALQGTTGEDIRKPNLLGQAVYFYAVPLADGNILRLSLSERHFYEVFFGTAPLVLLISLITVLAAYFAATFLTKKIIAPINHMAEDLDNLDETAIYPELIPFAQTVKENQRKKLISDQVRQEFTANVSHELKTPLTSISGYAEMIQTGFAKEQDIPVFAEKIHTESRRLLSLIADIIKLAELDETEEDFTFETVDLHELAEETITRLQLHAQKAGVMLSLDATYTPVLGSAKLLSELIYNLCDNAIRYNRPGGYVTMKTYLKGKQAVLLVRDNGIGIAPEEQDRIFERFYRVDKSRSKETGGTGLGLAIVKHITLRHHGTLDITSALDKGTTITITFHALPSDIFPQTTQSFM